MVGKKIHNKKYFELNEPNSGKLQKKERKQILQITFTVFSQNFRKNRSKKPFLGTFWKILARFFGARSPSKLVYFGAKGAFRKIVGSLGQK